MTGRQQAHLTEASLAAVVLGIIAAVIVAIDRPFRRDMRRRARAEG